MGHKFNIGQRVRIIAVDDIPYGLKYSYLDSTINKTGVIQEYDTHSSKYVIRLDQDGNVTSISESALETA
jgi:hypothetical protein